MAKFKVKFDRIGRGSRGFEEEFEAADPDELASKVYQHAKSRLASKNFEVLCINGHGYIEQGRFGTFTYKEIPS